MRPLVDFVHADQLPAADHVVAGASGPARVRTLSVDEATGGTSMVVDLSPGWTVTAAAWSADLELLVLAGGLDLGSHTVERLGYAFVPAGVPLPRLRAPAGASLLLFTAGPVRPEPVAGPADDAASWREHCVGPVALADVPWEQPRTPDFPAGAGRKTARLDEASGQGFWLLGLLPHWTSTQREWHEFAEENYVIDGEIETTVGLMTAGAYLAHPPGPAHRHGPMRSRRGALVVTRSVGPFATTYEPASDVTLTGTWP